MFHMNMEIFHRVGALAVYHHKKQGDTPPSIMHVLVSECNSYNTQGTPSQGIFRYFIFMQ